MIIAIPTCLLFGTIDPPPDLPGFTVTMRDGTWPTCTDGRRHYIIGADEMHWLLWEIEYLQEYRRDSHSNMPGMRLAKEGPLTPESADLMFPK